MGYCVYKHTSPTGKVYIGITGGKPEKRWRNGNGYYQNAHFKSAIDMYGWNNFSHEIIVDDITKEQACEIEKYLISKYKSNKKEFGYNKSTGGENPAQGVVLSAETRKKQSIAHKWYRPTEETKRKISEANKGKPSGRTGKTGKLCSKAKLIHRIDEATGKVLQTYYGYPEVERLHGYKKTPVREAALGIRKRAYGYKWEQKERTGKNVAV